MEGPGSSMRSRISQSRHWPWVLIGVHVVLLVVFALCRYVEIFDEGFYLSAANAVAHGRSLYSDFFYPQMPYLPYVLAPFTGHGFDTLVLTRFISCLPAVISIFLLYAILRRLSTNHIAVVAALGLYAFSGLIISSHTLIKTYTWTDLLLLLAFWSAATQYPASRNLLWIAVSGFCLSAAINFRLILAPIAIVFVVFITKNAESKRLRAAIVFLTATIVASIPSLVILSRDPKRFLFDNIGFHFMRNPGVDLAASLVQRAGVIVRTFANPQVLIILGLILVWFRMVHRPKRDRYATSLLSKPDGIAFLLMVAIVLIYLLPNPIHQQYFVQAVPFAVIVALRGIELFLERPVRFIAGISNRRLLSILSAIYVLGLIPYIAVFILAVRGPDRLYKIENIRSLSAFVRESVPDGPIFSEWTGLRVLTGRRSVPGLEFTGFDYNLPLSDSDKRYYHFPVNSDLKELLSQSIPAAYIVFNRPDTALEESALKHYCLTRTFGVFNVYTKKQDSLCR